jgi:uncharacterized protein (DUF2267 family)
MTVPSQYEFASRDFTRFLVDAREISGLTSTHQAYTMVEGVLRAFRRRLDVADALQFANLLPPLLRALFVADWDVGEARLVFEDRTVMTREVQSLRPEHNFAPDTSIRDVAEALRRNVDEAAFDRLLTRLPAGATDFWRS